MANTETSTKPASAKSTILQDLIAIPKYRLLLYKSLYPKDETISADDIIVLMSKNAIADGIFIELGLLVRQEHLIYVEAQTKWNVNVLPRAVLNISLMYTIFTERTGKVTVPQCDLFTIYTGEQPIDKAEISLIDEFGLGEANAINLTAKVISSPTEADILSQYIAFCKKLNMTQGNKLLSGDSISAIIQACKADDILKEYFESYEQKATEIITELISLQWRK